MLQMKKVDEASWLETEYGVELIGELLGKAKKPVSTIELRNHFKMTRQKFDMLLDALIQKKLLKIYANKPVITSPIVVITPKGKEFLRRYKLLIKILEEPNIQF
jgi:DNA-binding MarR family transcriptional regulator